MNDSKQGGKYAVRNDSISLSLRTISVLMCESYRPGLVDSTHGTRYTGWALHSYALHVLIHIKERL